MDLPSLIRSIVRDDDGLLGSVTVQVHPDYSYNLDVETLQRERVAFTRQVARIPHIEGGLSWKLIMPYTDGNGSLAMACIAIGRALGLWTLLPDPSTSPELFRLKSSMLPQSGVVTHWPRWAGIKEGKDLDDPEVDSQASKQASEGLVPGLDEDEDDVVAHDPGLAAFLASFR